MNNIIKLPQQRVDSTPIDKYVPNEYAETIMSDVEGALNMVVSDHGQPELLDRILEPIYLRFLEEVQNGIDQFEKAQDDLEYDQNYAMRLR